MTPEHKFMNEIRLWCGEHDYLCFRCNVGKYLLANGRYMDTGLPVGFPDLLILTNNGQIVFCECKVKPNKPSQEQLNFIKIIRDRGFKALVCYNISELEELINE